MSFRDKAAAVKAEGVAERGNFTPHGVPLRVYNYWLENSRSNRALDIRLGERKENFCHFWRVVALWAPLRWLKNKANAFIEHPATGPALLVLFLAGLVAACIMFGSVLNVLGVIAATAVAIALIAAGLAGGVTLAMGEERAREYDMPERNAAIVCSVLGLPTAIVGFLLAKGVILYNRHLSEYSMNIMLGLVVLAIVAFYVAIGVSEGWAALLMASLGTVVVIGVAAGMIWLGVLLSDYLSGKRKIAERQRYEARSAYYDEHGEWPAPPKREPGRIANFFRGLGDFIILLAQVIRVNKWKICPLVEVDSTDSV